MSVTEAPSSARPDDPTKARRKRLFRVAQVLVSVVVVVGIFALVMPKIADYRDVWRTITDLTWLELTTLILATIFNLFTYWWQMVAAMPGLTVWQAAVNNQSSTTIANILPGGGAIAVGIAVAMFRSWGFTGSEITLELTLTGIWNSFLKLGLPVIALAAVAIMGQASTALVVPAVVGLAILAGCIVLFALALWKKEFARSIGAGLGRAWSTVRGLVRKPPVSSWGDGAVRFRKQTIVLLAKRWFGLTVTTIVSHVALFLVLLLALRHVGVGGHEVSWAQALAVFAFGRLVTAIPLTPGGLGLLELTYISGLVLAARNHVTDVSPMEFHAQVAAAVLVFRTLTYGIQIPLGGFTYAIWRAKRSWRKPPPPRGRPRARCGRRAWVSGCRR
jgi:putative heme transporter